MKCLEAQDARQNSAEEIDMVINLGWAKNGRMEWVGEEIKAVKGICGEHVLKVIIETCLLTEEEKLQLCEVVSNSGADFIKNIHRFWRRRATFECGAAESAYIRPGLKLQGLRRHCFSGRCRTVSFFGCRPVGHVQSSQGRYRSWKRKKPQKRNPKRNYWFIYCKME